MSIHERLTEAYRRDQTSTNLNEDAARQHSRVLAEFGKYATHKRGSGRNNRWKSWLLSTAAGIALLGLLSGFAHYVSLRIHDERVSIRYEEGIHLAWDTALQAELQSLLQQVRSQLSEGESAVVYSPIIGKLYPELARTPLISVERPAMISNSAAWQTMLSQEADYAQLPDLKGIGLVFDKGNRERFIAVTNEDLSLLPELRREAEERAEAGGQPAAWRTHTADPVIDDNSASWFQYRSVYRDAIGNPIEIGVRREMKRTDFVVSVGQSASRQEVDLDGVKAVYVKNEHYFKADSDAATGQYQTVQWLRTAPDSTIVYSVGSESLAITKDGLIRIAQEIIQASNP